VAGGEGGVTAIVPTCDRPATLERALRSIAAQVVAPREIIVVNDGAAGDLAAARSAVARSACAPVTLLTNGGAPGPSGARNTGAAHATGAWLAFLDDDDEWLPTYLQEVTRRIQQCTLDVICTDLVYRYDDGSERPGKRACDALTPEQFLTRNPGLIGSNLVIRRRLYAAVGGFDESLRCAEDMDLGIRLSLHGGVRYAAVRAPLVRHHQHGGRRICTPQTEAVRSGIRRFYELHAARMTAEERQEFSGNVRRLWGIDEYGQLI
jgi:glycosyltransferase involved in cell wall biosynthesis